MIVQTSSYSSFQIEIAQQILGFQDSDLQSKTLVTIISDDLQVCDFYVETKYE